MSLSKFALASFTAAVLALGSMQESIAQSQSFFPSRPASASLFTIDGVLADYAVGRSSGTLTLTTLPSGVRQEFYIGYPMKIGGRIVKCTIPPLAGQAPNSIYCKDWPSNLVLGKTKVRITFWRMKAGYSDVSVSDQMDLLSP